MRARKIHPEGVFPAEIVRHCIKFSYAGNPQIIIKFRTAEGDAAAYLALTKRAAKYTAYVVKTCGYRGDDFGLLGTENDLLAGNIIEIEVKHKMFLNRKYATVAFVNEFRKEEKTKLEEENDAAAVRYARKFNDLL